MSLEQLSKLNVFSCRITPGVLVVENDQLLINSIEELFRQTKFTACTDLNITAALQNVNYRQTVNHAVLDRESPHSIYFYFIKHIRSTNGWEDAYVIVVSDKAKVTDIASCFKLIISDYVLQTFYKPLLLERENRLIKASP